MESKQLIDGEDIDDTHTITLNENGKRANKDFYSPLLEGLNLDLSFTAGGKASKQNKDAESMNSYGIQEESMLVIFDLPDGSQGESCFKLGHTVEVLKSFIESEYGIPMVDQTLFLDDKMMHNPFSLLDYPETKGVEEIYVRVEGNLPPNSKK